MSKEQTPIDFEAYLEKMGYSWNDFDYPSQIEGFAEQYAQAKVLEALEEEFDDLMISDCPCHEYKRGRDYYETEVKPKYK